MELGLCSAEFLEHCTGCGPNLYPKSAGEDWADSSKGGAHPFHAFHVQGSGFDSWDHMPPSTSVKLW